MNRRSFITALAGLPIVGLGTRMFGLSKPTAKSGITVHGPELIVVKRQWPAIKKGEMVTLPAGYNAFQLGAARTSLRFEHVPAASADEVVKWLKPIFWSANSCRFGRAPARTLIFDYHSVSYPKNGHCSVICAFKASLIGTTWNDSHRPVDFETEILKALTDGVM